MSARRTRTLEILEQLIAFPTVSRNSNLDLIDYVQALLQSAGFDVTRLWSPDRSKAGLFARIGPKIEGGVCFSAHTDVVPVDGQHWTRPAFSLTQDDGRLYGRGTTDMKGFLASALAMAERVQGDELVEPVSFVISYDEEIGCVGIRNMVPELSKLIGAPRLVIVGEPTSMQIATGHKGKSALRISCHGTAGHSALAPRFVNAIHVAARVIEELQTLQARLAQAECDEAYEIPYSTVHVGRIEGGRALNIVPDEVLIDMEYRHLPSVPAEKIETAVVAAMQKAEAAFAGARISMETLAAYPGLSTPRDHPAVDWMRGSVRDTALTKVAFGTEAGFFNDLGLPALVIGPGDMAADGHKPDEGLSVTQLEACDQMLENIRKKLSGRSF